LCSPSCHSSIHNRRWWRWHRCLAAWTRVTSRISPYSRPESVLPTGYSWWVWERVIKMRIVRVVWPHWNLAWWLGKLLSLTYKVLRTTQPSYVHNLISVQPPRSTRSSSLVTLARLPTSSSLRITDRSFRYASSCFCNQLPSSLHQPHSSTSVSDLLVHAPTTSSHSVNSHVLPSITPSVFHSRLKTYLFHESYPPWPLFRPQNWLRGLYDWTRSSEHLGFCFLKVFFITAFVCWFCATKAGCSSAV